MTESLETLAKEFGITLIQLIHYLHGEGWLTFRNDGAIVPTAFALEEGLLTPGEIREIPIGDGGVWRVGDPMIGGAT